MPSRSTRSGTAAPAAGTSVINGQTLASGQWGFAGNPGAVSYVGGASGGSETLYIAAFDGTDWSTSAANWDATGALTATTTQSNQASSTVQLNDPNHFSQDS